MPTPTPTYHPIYLGAYPGSGSGRAAGAANYYLNVPSGLTLQPTLPTSTGAGANGVTGVATSNYPNELNNGVVVNSGTIIGGTGVSGTSSDDGGVAIGTGSSGGIGVDLSFSVTPSGPSGSYQPPSVYALVNNGSIAGGAGGGGGEGAGGGQGGIGVSLSGYDGANSGPLRNFGTITGGAGGAGGEGVYAEGTGGGGGTGGTGVYLTQNDWFSNNQGVIRGGDGGAAPAGAANEPGNTSGSGGIGVHLGTNGFLSQYGDVYGGNGSEAIFTTGGNGGVGILLSASNAILFNHGFTEGGTGDGTGGSGGAGLQMTAGYVVDGQGGTFEGGAGNVDGGAGVLLEGGILHAISTITGGTGQSGGQADSVQFAGHAEMYVNSGAAFNGDIGGFTVGDNIIFQNITPTQLAGYINGDTITTTQDGTLVFSGLNGLSFSYTADGNGTDLSVACYRKGTHIFSEHGETAIEALRIGDRVLTVSGAMRPIRWIGQRRYSGSVAAGNWDVLPVRICKGALGAGVPWRDLWVSPEHAMWFDGVLIPARALTNGSTIFQEESVDEVTYLHIEFETHDVIYAEGALSESFVDDESREHFDNAPTYARLYPDATRKSARFYGPRIEDGEELEAVRRHLAAHALGNENLLDRGALADMWGSNICGGGSAFAARP